MSGKLKTLIDRYKREYKKVFNYPTDDPDSHEATLATLKSKIVELETSLHNQHRTAGSTNYRLWGEQINKYWTQFGKEEKTRDMITCLCRHGPSPPEYSHNSGEMASELALYHKNIQTNDILDQNEALRAEAIRESLSHIQRAPNTPVEPLGMKLSYNEIDNVIKNSAPSKSPGLDGIPSDFYIKLNDRWIHSKDSQSPTLDICALLQIVYNDIEDHGITCSSLLDGWLCPIYKKGDPRNPANYRPITVLNSSYKIFTTALMKKLSKIAPQLIHKDQAGFIPGRSIIDQINLAKAMIDLCEITEQEGALVALDQEKAYDKIRHDYLWEVLELFGLPHPFIKTIKTLYATVNTRVMVNGERSAPFPITRGVRQGDPISCLLFNLAIEPLALMLRNSPELNGLSIQLAGGMAQRIIASLFADDTTVYLSRRDSFSSLQQILDSWSFASGSRFNQPKTVVIPVGPKVYRDQVITTRSLNGTANNRLGTGIKILEDGESTRLLGAQVGYNLDESEIWSRQIEKITSALNRWDCIHPTLQGQSHIIRMVVRGMTQYLTAAQGMPNGVCNTLARQIRNFFWAGNTHSMVAEQYLFLPTTEGGWNLLDIKSRNEAITITKIKRLTDFGPSRPAWADAAVATMIALIPQSERARGDELSMHTPFLQNIWKRTRYGGSHLPPQPEDHPQHCSEV